VAKCNVSGGELRILLYVWRQTYGYHKKKDSISISQFQQKTGLSRQGVINALQGLRTRNVLQVVGKKQGVNEWQFNKYSRTWVHQEKQAGGEPRASQPECTSKEECTSQEELTSTSQVELTKTSQVECTHKRKKERKKKKTAGADPRFQPLKKFFHEQYEEIRGTKLVTDVSDYAGLRKLLKQNPEFSLEDLQQAAVRYLRSDKPFHVDQGHPLRYWANNINPFLPGRKQWVDDLKEVN